MTKKLTEAEARARAWEYARFKPYADAPYPGALKGWPGLCPVCEVNEIRPRLNSLQQHRSTSCRPCTNNRIGDAGRIAESEARRLVQEWDGFVPFDHEPYQTCTTPWSGLCTECGQQEVRPRLNDLRKGHRALCQGCNDRIRLQWLKDPERLRYANAKRSASTIMSDAEARRRALEHAGFRPHLHIPYPGYDTPWRGPCVQCGQAEVRPTLHRLLSGYSEARCRPCSGRGVDLGAPARVYMVAHLTMHALKVGITTAEHDTRLDDYRRAGWQLVSIHRYATRADALDAERKILADWRAQGYPEACTEADMPMGGWTETAPLSALPGWELLLTENQAG